MLNYNYSSLKREVLMKVFQNAFFIALTALIASGIASAVQEGASIEKGKMMFNDTKLGTTGKSCNSCHPGGKGLEKSGSRKDLTDIINGCITIPLKGKALDPKSVEMESLVLYIKSLGAK
jgi:cytochrome c peroxidase